MNERTSVNPASCTVSGRDPLAGLNHWKDINAVAGVLRCYFRELQDPLFPKAYYQEFIDASSESMH